MKTNVKVGFVAGLLMAASIVTLGNSNLFIRNLEVPGDHFSLEGALELFKRSKSPQEFEQLLNTPETKVNNLDLNGDGHIDYIRVIDKHERNVHAFILQAVISPKEYQDVAVIELEKLANGKAVLQIVGDEDIYGIETIIEPSEEVYVNAGTSTVRTYVNVWSWPSVQYVYDPFYTVWISPWDWYSTPYWWTPWRPVTYVVYRPYWEPYRRYYSVCHSHRVVYAREMYYPVRRTSTIVYDRHYRELGQVRASRGRDGYYYDHKNDNDRSDRTRPTYSNDGRSQNRTRTSTTGERTSGSGTSGRTRIVEDHERAVVHETPTRTQQRSVDVERENPTPRERVDQPARSTQREERSVSHERSSSPPQVEHRSTSHDRSSSTPQVEHRSTSHDRSSSTPQVEHRSTSHDRPSSTPHQSVTPTRSHDGNSSSPSRSSSDHTPSVEHRNSGSTPHGSSSPGHSGSVGRKRDN